MATRRVVTAMTPDARMKPELDAAVAALPGGIGMAIRYVKAAPLMEKAIRDIAAGYLSGLPEEIEEPIKAALDILNGGDGVIYR